VAFIISDAVTFGAILMVFSYLRAGTPNWNAPFRFSPSIINGLVMTFVLLTSSLTMLGAVEAAKAGRKAASLKWLGGTVLLGRCSLCSTSASGFTCSMKAGDYSRTPRAGR